MSFYGCHTQILPWDVEFEEEVTSTRDAQRCKSR